LQNFFQFGGTGGMDSPLAIAMPIIFVIPAKAGIQESLRGISFPLEFDLSPLLLDAGSSPA
jgi:hypothetical protein